MKQRLIRRFRQLWVLELVNAFVIFPFVLYTISQRINLGLFAVVALVAADFLLIVGATFSYLKMRDLQRNTRKLRRYEPHFRALRRCVPLLLAVCLLPVLSEALTRGATGDVIALVPGIFLYLLAILEYINYFHIQLMYDNRSDLRDLLATRRFKAGLIAREYGWQNVRR